MDNNHMPKPEAVNVRDLLPQQPPFVMVDCLLGFDNDTTTCGYTNPSAERQPSLVKMPSSGTV